MPPSNMSIQPGSADASGHLRPSMQQDDHPEHNMPEPEHDGEITEPKMSDRPGANNMISNMGSRSALGAAQRAKNNQ